MAVETVMFDPVLDTVIVGVRVTIAGSKVLFIELGEAVFVAGFSVPI